jgi:hypothetical protein
VNGGPPTTSPPGRPRRFDDRGAGLIETALVTPVFLLLVFGILEFGLVFRAYLAVGDTASEGARVGAIQGPDPTTAGANADFSIVKAVRENTASLELDSIERIVVFRGAPSSAGAPLDQVPDACKDGASVAGSCNVYPARASFYAVQEGDTDYFDCSAGGLSCAWDPSTRNNGPRVADIEYLGVYIRYRHPFATGLFGNELNLEAASILRLEPGTVE